MADPESCTEAPRVRHQCDHAGVSRPAWLLSCSYAEALALAPSAHPAHPRMLANRALAYSKASRFADALADADAAVALAPTWDKAHWRRGAALAGLKRPPDAAAAYHRAWQLSKGAKVAPPKLYAEPWSCLLVYEVRLRSDVAPATLGHLIAKGQTHSILLPCRRSGMSESTQGPGAAPYTGATC